MNLKEKGYSWKKLSQFYQATPEPGTKDANEMFPGYEGLWCKLIMAVTAFAATDNAVALIYGPQNCNWAVRNFKTTNYALFYGNAFIHMPTVNVDQNIVIMGGTEKLIEGIKQVDTTLKPEVIGVFDSCAPALIGDDVETACKIAQKDCIASVKYFPSAGLTTPWLGKTIEDVSSRYITMMEESETIPNTVNIVGQYKEKYCIKRNQKDCNFHDYLDEAEELTQYVEALDLKVHRVLISGGKKYIETASQASVNMISCPTWGYPIATLMKESFGIPFGRHAIPMGFDSTKNWIMELANITNREDLAEKFVQKEFNKVASLTEKVKNISAGKIALIECGRNTQSSLARALALGRMTEEIGMLPYFFNVHPLEVKAKRFDVDYFLYDGFNPQVLFGPYPYQKPVSLLDVIKDLGLEKDQFVYFSEDVFPFAKAGNIDVSDTAKVETSVHLRRIKNATARGMGFSGNRSILEQIYQSIKTAQRSTKPTLYSRVNGQFFEFERCK